MGLPLASKGVEYNLVTAAFYIVSLGLASTLRPLANGLTSLWLAGLRPFRNPAVDPSPALSYGQILGCQYLSVGRVRLAHWSCALSSSPPLTASPLGPLRTLTPFSLRSALLLHSATALFAPFFVFRVALGVFESVVSPILIATVASWFKKSEQARVVGAWYAMNGVTLIVGGALAYGITTAYEGPADHWRVVSRPPPFRRPPSPPISSSLLLFFNLVRLLPFRLCRGSSFFTPPSSELTSSRRPRP